MSGVNDQRIEDGVFELVALLLRGSGESKLPLPRPDPTFITHLIASAERLPQPCGCRRATPADAQLAYAPSRHQHPGTGFQTRQVI